MTHELEKTDVQSSNPADIVTGEVVVESLVEGFAGIYLGQVLGINPQAVPPERVKNYTKELYQVFGPNNEPSKKILAYLDIKIAQITNKKQNLW